MKLGLALTMVGAMLALSAIAYIGWALVYFTTLIGSYGGWDTIAPMLLYVGIVLIPSVVILFFGIKRLRSR